MAEKRAYKSERRRRIICFRAFAALKSIPINESVDKEFTTEMSPMQIRRDAIMKLCEAGLKDREAWIKAGYRLPEFDRDKVRENTRKAPRWIHFGVGNIFRAFQANVMKVSWIPVFWRPRALITKLSRS